VRSAAEEENLSPAETDALVSSYADAQLLALKVGLLFAALLSCAALLVTGSLPTQPPSRAPPDVPREHAVPA
jgi:hypothetical protein